MSADTIDARGGEGVADDVPVPLRRAALCCLTLAGFAAGVCDRLIARTGPDGTGAVVSNKCLEVLLDMLEMVESACGVPAATRFRDLKSRLSAGREG